MDYENCVKVVSSVRNGAIEGKPAYRVTLQFGEGEKAFNLDVTTLKDCPAGWYSVRPCVKFLKMENGKKRPYASFRIGERV